MEHTIDRLNKIKVDAIYGKKKHFNAADRLQKYHYIIGAALITVNVLTGSVLISTLKEGAEGWMKYTILALPFLAALLGGYQTLFNLQKKVEGHRRVGNKYLAIMKKCDRLQAYVKDKQVSPEELRERIEEIATAMEDINREAESFPTSDRDYQKAKEGIEAGEENYNTKELDI